MDLSRFSTILSALVGGFTAGMVGAWVTAGPVLREALALRMKANTAASLLLLALSLLLHVHARGRRAFVVVSGCTAVLAALIGTATLLEDVAGLELGIDQLLALDALNEESRLHPGRMAPNAALGLLLLGASLSLLGKDDRLAGALRTLLLTLATAVSLVAIAGYLFEARAFYQLSSKIRISAYSALSLALLSVGGLAAAPRGTAVEIFARKSSAGRMARRLLFPALLLPLLVVWAFGRSEDVGLFSRAVADALSALSLVLLFGLLVWRSARALDAIDSQEAGHASELARLDREARQALEAREEFLSIAAHELRTPLTTLQLQLQRLQRLALAPEPEKLGEVTRAALEQVERLNRLANEITDATSMGGDAPVQDWGRTDLASLVRHLAENLQIRARKAGCALAVATEDGLFAAGNARQIEQALEHLAANALKYGRGKPVELALRRDGGQARLTVRDHGIGIPAADLPRIFERFSRAAPAKNYGGLGLGLHIARHVAELHGGSIQVESEPGQGATFTLVLPLAVDR